ncbi:YraN family protein [uncultured Roseicyclus sp.]|jgi:putative endonuclease|uniref:YraN family protein n=1 Tax=uncultured Roseicyclus sp. TaxID=543072 RepID=UPI00262D31B1|nr:YraN family protein [uncultured Roseicyclus sp.]
MSGLKSYLTGKAAEDAVLAAYCATGHRLVCRRWRGPGGEIDLVLEKAGEVVFVEVKASHSFAAAAAHVSRPQIARLLASAEAGLGYFGKGALTPMRFDVALVDGQGRIDVIANALQAGC